MKSYKSSSTNVSFYTFKYNKTNGPSGFWGCTTVLVRTEHFIPGY